MILQIPLYSHDKTHQVSTQSAERALEEQLGLPATSMGELIHCHLVGKQGQHGTT